MKSIKYHLINAGIAGGLVILGSLSTLLVGNPTLREIEIGILLGIFAGVIIFLNKFNDWFRTQDPDYKPKLLEFI